MANTVIEARGLTKILGHHRACNVIDFHIQRGEVFGLLAGGMTVECALDGHEFTSWSSRPTLYPSMSLAATSMTRRVRRGVVQKVR